MARGRGWAIASLAAAAAGSSPATDRFNEPEPQLERQPRFERVPAKAPAPTS